VRGRGGRPAATPVGRRARDPGGYEAERLGGPAAGSAYPGAPMVEEKPSPDFEEYPLTRPEYIAALVHLYRGEMHRALTWRQRLDTTTNWAIVTSGGIVSFLFTNSTADVHIVGILAILLVFFLLCYEARRFRFFDVWRARVRKLEENFYVPLLRRDLTSPIENWGFVVAEDLLTPRFKISFLTAMRARLIRNYIPVFLVLFGAWITKLIVHPGPLVPRNEGGHAHTLRAALKGAGIGPFPYWIVVGFVVAIFGFLLFVGFFCKKPRTQENLWWSAVSDESVDEIS
jgi:uncharacterized membrane protein